MIWIGLTRIFSILYLRCLPFMTYCPMFGPQWLPECTQSRCTWSKTFIVGLVVGVHVSHDVGSVGVSNHSLNVCFPAETSRIQNCAFRFEPCNSSYCLFLELKCSFSNRLKTKPTIWRLNTLIDKQKLYRSPSLSEVWTFESGLSASCLLKSISKHYRSRTWLWKSRLIQPI